MAIGGIVGVVLLVGAFGLKALVGFSVFVDKLRGGVPTPTPGASFILPPTLDPPYEATNTATISVTGKGSANLTLIVYLNNAEFKKQAVPADGKFTVSSVPLSDGTNSISAKLTDDRGNTSDLSNVVSVIYASKPPKLDVTAPSDNATVTGDPNSVTVSGTTDDGVTITINDRFVVIRSDSSFSYNFPLNDGDNTLTIVATDKAGNQTKITRKVTYRR